MIRKHSVEFNPESMSYQIYRIIDGGQIILGEVFLADLLGEDYNASLSKVAKRIGEIIFLDSKDGIEEAYRKSSLGKPQN